MRILKNLRIDEVSCVIKGAGNGTRVMIRKADQPSFEEIFARLRFSKRRRVEDEGGAKDFNTTRRINAEENDERDPDDVESTLPPGFGETIAAMILANPKLSKQEVARFLLTPRGAALHAALKKRKDTIPMDRSTELRAIAKDFGFIPFCKYLADNPSATRDELYPMAWDEAQKTRKAGERPNSCFSRWYQSDEALPVRKAMQNAPSVVRKGAMDLMPTKPLVTFTSDRDAAAKAVAQINDLVAEMGRNSPTMTLSDRLLSVYNDPQWKELTDRALGREPLNPQAAEAARTFVDDDDGGVARAMEELRGLAEDLRSKFPRLSADQAFARVFADPENAELANRAHRRPAFIRPMAPVT